MNFFSFYKTQSPDKDWKIRVADDLDLDEQTDVMASFRIRYEMERKQKIAIRDYSDMLVIVSEATLKNTEKKTRAHFAKMDVTLAEPNEVWGHVTTDGKSVIYYLARFVDGFLAVEVVEGVADRFYFIENVKELNGYRNGVLISVDREALND